MFFESLILLFASGLILWSIRPHRFRFAGWLALIPPALVTVWQSTLVLEIAAGSPLSRSYSWAPSLGLDLAFRLDGLSLLFGLIISGVGAAVALYTHGYLHHDQRQGYFYLALFAFMASMLGLVWADNLLTLFVFWEGTSITSYLLIGYDHRNAAARGGARNALIITGAGGLVMLVGMVLAGQAAGTYTISELVISPALRESTLFAPALVLILIGAFTKSAQFPFHFWLPGAMSAPTPASAYLHSATMVKAGIYLMARLRPGFGESELWFWSLLIIGGLTMLVGAFFAINNWDMKGLLAYATVGQLGVLTFLLAFPGEEAYLAVILGILAHALYKGPLFLVAGIIDHATGTRDLRQLARIARLLPWTGTAAILSILSMAGLPPLFGFVAKESLLETVFHYAEGMPGVIAMAIIAAAIAVGALFVGYSLTLLWEVFLRGEASAVEQASVDHPPAASMVLPAVVIALLGTALPFLLLPVETLVIPAAESIGLEPIKKHLALWHGLTPAFWSSMAAIGIGVVLFALRGQFRRTLSALPERARGIVIFNDIVEGTYALGNRTARYSQGYTLGTQAAVVLIAALVPVIVALVQSGWEPLRPRFDQPVDLTMIVLASVTILGALSTIRAESRLGAIISLGVVGVTVTLFYVLFSAPDLALTQLLIEVLTLVLLVLVFAKLPADKRPPVPLLRQARVLLISLAAGLFGAGLVLFNSSPHMQVGEAISSYFLQHAVPDGHGGNVVNVILVDFRGFDTLGEVTVLALAALGGYALLNAPRVRLPGQRPATEVAESESEIDAESETGNSNDA